MPALKFKDSKGWYFKFQWQGKAIKREVWKNEKMLTKNEALQAESECIKLLELGIEPSSLKGKLTQLEIDNLVNEVKHKDGYISLYELYNEFLLTNKATIKPSSVKSYETFKNHYLPLIKDVSIWKLTNYDIVMWKSKIMELEATDYYKNRQLNKMKAILNYGTIVYGLSGKLQLPLLEKIKSNEVAVIDDRTKHLIEPDFKILINQFADDLYYFTILNLMYYTGLRIGELAALTVDDYKNKTLTINKSYVRVAGKDYIQAPKSAVSIRKVVLDDHTAEILETYILKFKPKKTLFNKKSEYLNQQKLRFKIRQAAHITGLDEKYIITPHTLRHSHNSNLRLLGYDATIRGARLGNSALINESVYTHASIKEQYDIAEKLNKK